MPLFKISRKSNHSGAFSLISHTKGSQKMHDIIEHLEGDRICPSNGIPYKYETDGWADDCAVGSTYDTDNYTIEYIS